MIVPDAVWHRARLVFHGFRLDDPGTTAEIRRLHEACGYLADPHSAIGIAAARATRPANGVQTVAMATAHPAKFPDAIEQAVGFRPELPPSTGGFDGEAGTFCRAAERSGRGGGERSRAGGAEYQVCLGPGIVKSRNVSGGHGRP